jgi:hypothetical protein
MHCGFGWVKDAKYAQFEIRDEDGYFASDLGQNM